MTSFKIQLKPLLRRVPGFRIARFLLRLLKGVESRNSALILLRPPKGLYQPYGTTSIDRYPGIFQFVRQSVGDSATTHILSFGCSTGEEVFCLRRYFPEAVILGLDINPFNIAVCRFRHLRRGDKGINFATAGSTAREADASYDAIFAMPNSSHLIRFADFEQSVADLARVLKPGGLLVIENAMFRFCDTRLARDFETVLKVDFDDWVPLYGRNNVLLPDSKYPDVVFRKIR